MAGSGLAFKQTSTPAAGDIAGQLLAADLPDGLILTVAPTFVGRGPALADGDFRSESSS